MIATTFSDKKKIEHNALEYSKECELFTIFLSEFQDYYTYSKSISARLKSKNRIKEIFVGIIWNAIYFNGKLKSSSTWLILCADILMKTSFQVDRQLGMVDLKMTARFMCEQKQLSFNRSTAVLISWRARLNSHNCSDEKMCCTINAKVAMRTMEISFSHVRATTSSFWGFINDLEYHVNVNRGGI